MNALLHITNMLRVIRGVSLNKFNELFSVIRKKYLSCRRNKSKIDYGKKESTFGIPLECDF